MPCASARTANAATSDSATTEDGWNRARAQDELQNVLADVRRGIWRPPASVRQVEIESDPTFHRFASEWFTAHRSEWAPNTVLDYEWQLRNHLLPFFAAHRLSQITIAEVDRYRQTKVDEATLSAESTNKTITRLGQILEVAIEYELVARNPVRVNPRRRKLKAARRGRCTSMAWFSSSRCSTRRESWMARQRRARRAATR
jgi:integrase